MNKLKKIKEKNIRITWRLIEIGYLENEFIKKQLDKDDIIEYAYTILERIEASDPNLEDIVTLITDKKNEDIFREALLRLSKRELSEDKIERQKWIVFLTDEMINNLNDDWWEGILELNEFWIEMGQPKNSPHIFQCVDNNISPQEYYTEKMYKVLIEKHKQWIKDEVRKFAEYESN